jgi:hypothetical protein
MRHAKLRAKLAPWRGAANLTWQIIRIARLAFGAGLHVPPPPREAP